LYALLYIPPNPEHGIFSTRKQDGLKLYSRKILIQEYCRDLLPEYFGFVQGVVDSEDLPLNVSRESVQANRIMANLKKLVTGKVLEMLTRLSTDEAGIYGKFWELYARFIKQGVAVEQNQPEELYPFLRFHTQKNLLSWSSLDDYIGRMPEGQTDIYYLFGEDERSVQHSPHLDLIGKHDYEVLLLTDPLDSFVMVRLNEYKDHKLTNVAAPELELPPLLEDSKEQLSGGDEAPAEMQALVERFKEVLGERVGDVRLTERLTEAPARLVDPAGAPNLEMQRVYHLLDKDFEPPKKVLELNQHHPILVSLKDLPAGASLSRLVIEQVFEDALLIEGLHPDPASMIARVQEIMKAALDK